MWYLKSAPANLSNWNILRKKKMPKFENKNPFMGFFIKSALFWYFWAGILRKTIVIFEISTLKYVYLQIWQKSKDAQMWNQKCLI